MKFERPRDRFAGRSGRFPRCAPRAPTLRALRHQSMAHHVEISERKGGQRADRVLVQAPIPHDGKAPEALDDVKRMLAPRPDPRTLPIGASRSGVRSPR